MSVGRVSISLATGRVELPGQTILWARRRIYNVTNFSFPCKASLLPLQCKATYSTIQCKTPRQINRRAYERCISAPGQLRVVADILGTWTHAAVAAAGAVASTLPLPRPESNALLSQDQYFLMCIQFRTGLRCQSSKTSLEWHLGSRQGHEIQNGTANDEELEDKNANPAAQQSRYFRSTVLRSLSHGVIVATDILGVDNQGCAADALGTVAESAHGERNSRRGLGAGDNEEMRLPVGMNRS